MLVHIIVINSRRGRADFDGGGNAAGGAAAQLRGDFLAAADMRVSVTVRGMQRHRAQLPAHHQLRTITSDQ